VEWIFRLSGDVDYEVIIADNSDNSEIIESLFEDKKLQKNKNLKILKSEQDEGGVKALPMNENWERCLRAAKGEWVIFIGDDDIVDPNSSKLLQRINQQLPSVEFVWNARTVYTWPDFRSLNKSSGISLLSGLRAQNIENLRHRIINFEGSGLPTGLAPYHNFIRRSLIERVWKDSPISGVFFFHENTDYFMGFILAMHATGSIYCERPLSVMGVCKKSNSAALETQASMERSIAAYESELANSSRVNAQKEKFYSLARYHEIRTQGGDQFHSKTLYVFSLFLGFCEQYGKSPGPEIFKNLRKCLEAEYLANISVGESAEIFRENANRFIKTTFKNQIPAIEAHDSPKGNQFLKGFLKEEMKLYLPEDFGGNKSVGEFYFLINQMLVEYSLIGKNYQVNQR
jgi:hypothetical protein